MALSKTLRTSVAAASSNAAGATTTGTALDLTTKYGGVAHCKVTNGGTGPTVGCTAKLMISGDNSAFKTYRQFAAGLTNSGVYEFAAELPLGVMYMRWDFTGNTGQAVMVEGFLEEVTTV